MYTRAAPPGLDWHLAEYALGLGHLTKNCTGLAQIVGQLLSLPARWSFRIYLVAPDQVWSFGHLSLVTASQIWSVGRTEMGESCAPERRGERGAGVPARSIPTPRDVIRPICWYPNPEEFFSVGIYCSKYFLGPQEQFLGVGIARGPAYHFSRMSRVGRRHRESLLQMQKASWPEIWPRSWANLSLC